MFDFGLYTQVSDSGPHGPLVLVLTEVVVCFTCLYGYLTLPAIIFTHAESNIFYMTVYHCQRIFFTGSIIIEV